MSLAKNKTLAFSFCFFWLALCTYLLTIPGNELPTRSWLDKIWFDKWVHIGLFGIMVWLGCRAVFFSSTKTIVLFAVISVLSLCYGIAMEFVQRDWVANRSFDNGDIIADGIGCLLGLLISLKWYRKK